MLCPYCLSEVSSFTQTPSRDGKHYAYSCPNSNCKEIVPTMYVAQYDKYPNVVVNAVGFTRHGKTGYFSSLFYDLWVNAAERWANREKSKGEGFYAMALNDKDLELIYGNIAKLKKGELYDVTPKVFPRPTIVQINNFPGRPANVNCSLLVYDVSGEAFDSATELVEYASFVKGSPTVMFMISIPDIEAKGDDIDLLMYRLLNTYVMGITNLGGDTSRQDLVVIYTKADLIEERLNGPWADLQRYLHKGVIDPELRGEKKFMLGLRKASNRLREFTQRVLKATMFLNLADQRFRSVRFSLVSALGAAPDKENNRLSIELKPRCILHPLIWNIVKSVLERRRPD